LKAYTFQHSERERERKKERKKKKEMRTLVESAMGFVRNEKENEGLL